MKITLLAVFLSFPMLLAAQQQEPGTGGPVRPQVMNAMRLLQMCASSSLTAQGRRERSYCAGFVSGVEESARLLGPFETGGAPTVCVDRDVTARMLAETYVKYASRNAGKLEEPAAHVVLDALREAYPCHPGGR